VSQSWAGKLKSAIEGMVDGADARARLASTASLASLRQQLADRRLDAELANIEAPWRVPFVLAPIAAPLWLAEGLVTLAQSFVDAEAAAHPDRPTMMFALTHGQVLVLLEPVDVLQGDISGTLADPNRRAAMSLPQAARPFAHTGAGLMTDRIPVPYARGLLAGAISLAGSTHMLIDDYGKLLQHASAPAWLHSGLATINGDLAAAQTRLDAMDLRAAPVLRQPQPDQGALRDLVVDLWDLANTFLKAGQLVSAPSLMPSAQPLPGSAPPPVPHVASTNQSAAPVVTPRPAAPIIPPPTAQAISPSPVSVIPPSAPEPIVAMPAIGGTSPRAEAPATVRMPDIGAASPAHTDKTTSPLAARVPDIGGTNASPGAPLSAPRQMPAIGARASAPGVSPYASPPVVPAATPDQPRAMPQIGGRQDTPPLAKAPATSAPAAPSRTESAPAAGGGRIERKDRWLASAQPARYRMRAAGQEDQAEAQLAAFWAAKDWTLSVDERRYLDQVAQLLKSGAIAASGRSLADVPFPAIYRVGNAPQQVLDRVLRPGTLFSYDFRAGKSALLVDLPPQSGIPDA
jgi:hypothetical protein